MQLANYTYFIKYSTVFFTSFGSYEIVIPAELHVILTNIDSIFS